MTQDEGKNSKFSEVEEEEEKLDEEGEKGYEPSEEETKLIKEVYDFRDFSNDEIMGASYPEMNNRTPNQFWDDSQKRANAYVPTREEQGKAEWQANIFTGTTRNKLRAYCASVAKTPPEIRCRATNENNEVSALRGELAAELLRHSYEAYSNPELTILEDSWSCGVNGTRIVYDGFLKIKDKTEVIESFDASTGKVKFKYEDALVEHCPIEIPIDPNYLLISDPYEPNIQKQDKLIWLRYMTLEQFKASEFGHFKNSEFVQYGSVMTDGERDLFMGDKWSRRLVRRNSNDDGRGDFVEVLCFYAKKLNGRSVYRVIANGVLLLDAPLLWGKRRKIYPFAKTVFEFFASRLFWGNSMPNIIMDLQDSENSMMNSMLDKTSRTLVPPTLIGLANKDAFDLEDEWVTGDTKIYVEDVNQVKPMPIPQVSSSEFEMLKMVVNQITYATADNLQQGVSSGGGATAREIVISNERAAEFKGLFFTMLKDLWLQKYRIRLINLITNLPLIEATDSAKGQKSSAKKEFWKTLSIPNAKLSTGRRGNMVVHMTEDQSKIEALQKPMGYRENGLPYNELDVREEMARSTSSVPTEILVIPKDFLDYSEYELYVETESLYQRGKALDLALSSEKVGGVAKLFPEIFAQNRNKFFESFIAPYGDDPDKYLENMNQAPAPIPGMEQQLGAADGGNGAGNLMSQLSSPTKSLNVLAGTAINTL